MCCDKVACVGLASTDVARRRESGETVDGPPCPGCVNEVARRIGGDGLEADVVTVCGKKNVSSSTGATLDVRVLARAGDALDAVAFEDACWTLMEEGNLRGGSYRVGGDGSAHVQKANGEQHVAQKNADPMPVDTMVLAAATAAAPVRRRVGGERAGDARGDVRVCGTNATVISAVLGVGLGLGLSLLAPARVDAANRLGTSTWGTAVATVAVLPDAPTTLTPDTTATRDEMSSSPSLDESESLSETSSSSSSELIICCTSKKGGITTGVVSIAPDVVDRPSSPTPSMDFPLLSKVRISATATCATDRKK
jgi:hypothetical protein